MMKAKIKICFMTVLMITGISVSAMSAFAYQGETARQTAEELAAAENLPDGTRAAGSDGRDEEAVPSNTDGATAPDNRNVERNAVLDEISEREENAARDETALVGTIQGSETGGTPFSIPGNGLLLDDRSEDGTKQFLTIRTKNNHTFFLVLDRSSNMENVYMLSMIDENDLAEFIEENEDQSKTDTPALVIPQKDPVSADAESEVESGKENNEIKKEKVKVGNKNAVIILAVFLIGGVGGLYYFKVVKPKSEEENGEDEDLEFCDEGDYINEDEDDYGRNDEDEE